jgi:nucleotide-binding universal stress UspA family protein
MIHFNSTRVLIPVDFSDTSLLAIRHGAYIANQTAARLFLLHVVNAHYVSQNMFLPLVTIDQGEVESKASEKLNELAEDIKRDFNVEIQTVIKVGTPSIEVVKVAREINASLIVMGTHGYGPLENLVIGSVALKVLTKAHCPTMAMSAAATHSGYKKIVLPIDNTVNSRQKVNFTLEFAKKFGATVHAIALLTHGEEDDKPSLELVLHQIELLAKEHGVAYHSEVLENLKNRATATVSYVEKISADLLVIMTDQDAELSGFFLGPYSQQIIHHSKVPVIAIKPQDIFNHDTSPIPGTSGAYF